MSYIYVKKRKYYYYDHYPTWRHAYNVARYYRRKDNTRYKIEKRQIGTMFPRTRYVLYMNKVVRP